MGHVLLALQQQMQQLVKQEQKRSLEVISLRSKVNKWSPVLATAATPACVVAAMAASVLVQPRHIPESDVFSPHNLHQATHCVSPVTCSSPHVAYCNSFELVHNTMSHVRSMQEQLRDVHIQISADQYVFLLLLLLLQVANAQDERDEAVKARDTAERERDAAVSKVGEAAQRQGGWGNISVELAQGMADRSFGLPVGLCKLAATQPTPPQLSKAARATSCPVACPCQRRPWRATQNQ
jgi:hypothetical protein